MAQRPHDAIARRKAGRLSRSGEFDRAYRHGRSVANRYLVLYTFPRDDGQPLRAGFSVGRRLGSAPERNRLRRLLREALRPREAALTNLACDLVVVARPDARELAAGRGLEGIDAALAELLGKAGLSTDEPAL